MIKLIVSDMDGSLLNSKDKLPDNFFDVLKELDSRDIRFVVASGRSYCTLYDNFIPHSDSIDYIADNGTCVVENGEIIYKNVLSRSDVAKVANLCKNIQGIHLILCGSKGAYITEETGWFLTEIDRYYRDRFIVKDLANVDDDIFKIGIYDTIGAEDNSYKLLSGELLNSSMTIVISGNNWTDIMNKGANKGEALKKIQQQHNISKDETMVFGDYYNDIEMLMNAKYSFVMENSNDDMKKYGNFIAKSNDDNGVIEAIKEHVLHK